MAAPAVIPVIKTVVAIASDKRKRKAVLMSIGSVIAAFVFVIVILLNLMSATVAHNNKAVTLSFFGGIALDQTPEEYKQYIETMRVGLEGLEAAINEILPMVEDGALDRNRVKAIFYSLFFGSDHVQMGTADYRRFANCFVRYEERTRTEVGEYGEPYGVTYMIAIPITDLNVVYRNIEQAFDKIITEENKSNAQRIYAIVSQGGGLPGTGLPPGSAMGDGSYAALMAEATKYIGYPYVWGGSTPSTSFDCSGYICWVYTQSGVYHLPRTTAQGIYNQCSVVSRADAKPGDLVFFTGTYAAGVPVSHIGIYVGDGQMLHCGNPISYASIDSAYWSSHFYAFGRLPGTAGE